MQFYGGYGVDFHFKVPIHGPRFCVVCFSPKVMDRVRESEMSLLRFGKEVYEKVLGLKDVNSQTSKMKSGVLL